MGGGSAHQGPDQAGRRSHEDPTLASPTSPTLTLNLSTEPTIELLGRRDPPQASSLAGHSPSSGSQRVQRRQRCPCGPVSAALLLRRTRSLGSGGQPSATGEPGSRSLGGAGEPGLGTGGTGGVWGLGGSGGRLRGRVCTGRTPGPGRRSGDRGALAEDGPAEGSPRFCPAHGPDGLAGQGLAG